MKKSKPIVNIHKINAHLTSLREQERSAATIQKYGHDLRTFLDFAGKMPFSKITVIAWKEQLMASYVRPPFGCFLLRNGASDSLRGNYQNLRKY